MTEDTLESREAYVIYIPNRGYMKNRNGDFVKDFTKARVFGRTMDADHSIKMHKEVQNLEGNVPAFVIPVEMTLDPRQIFKAVLKGKQ